MGNGVEERVLPKSRSRSAKGGEDRRGAKSRPRRGGLARDRRSGGTVGNVGRVGHGAIYEEVSAGFEDVDGNILDILYQYEIAMDGEEEEDLNRIQAEHESSQSRGGARQTRRKK